MKDQDNLNSRLYSSLFLIRRIEEEITCVYPTDKIKSPIHLSIGQEAISVGVCAALRPQNIVFGTYHSHALYLTMGGDLKKMIVDQYGKVTGCTRGRGLDASDGLGQDIEWAPQQLSVPLFRVLSAKSSRRELIILIPVSG